MSFCTNFRLMKMKVSFAERDFFWGLDKHMLRKKEKHMLDHQRSAALGQGKNIWSGKKAVFHTRVQPCTETEHMENTGFGNV